MKSEASWIEYCLNARLYIGKPCLAQMVSLGLARIVIFQWVFLREWYTLSLRQDNPIIHRNRDVCSCGNIQIMCNHEQCLIVFFLGDKKQLQ